MANRRMFSLDIVDSDAFLDMPLSTQALYFHLGMRADDDGFISNPKRIMKVLDSKDDDYKLLLAKRFLLAFKDGVCVIKHWRMNNFIRTDRYKETAYLEHKNTLIIKDNGAYSDSGIPAVDQRYTQDRIGEDRLGKDRREEAKTTSSLSYLKEISQEELEDLSLQYEIPIPFIRNKAEELYLYCERKGKKYKNYRAFLIGAIKKDYKPSSQKVGIKANLNNK